MLRKRRAPAHRLDTPIVWTLSQQQRLDGFWVVHHITAAIQKAQLQADIGRSHVE